MSGRLRFSAAGLLLVLAACAGPSPPAPPSRLPTLRALAPAPPVSVRMDPGLGARLDSIVTVALREGAASGVSLAVGRHGRLVHLRGYGRIDSVAGAAEVDEHTLFDIASITKVVATTTAAMILEEEGRLDLDSAVAAYLPELDHPAKAGITVRMLLTHRGGLEAFAPLYLSIRGRDAFLRAINTRPLEARPGTTTLYSDWDFVLLQLVIERITGQTLDVFLRQRVFQPLGMSETAYPPLMFPLSRVAATQVDSTRGGLIHGDVHDPNAWGMGGVAGHAGLFSSAADLAVFAQMLLNGGSYADARIVRPETLARWTARQHAGSSRALGWDTPTADGSAGRYFSPRSFGHTGYTGTSFWVDPERGLFVVLLANRVNVGPRNQRHVPLRRAVADAAQAAILDSPLMDWEAAR